MMNNLKQHALEEFRIAGWMNEDGKYNDEMQEAICKNVLKLLDVLNEEGHSGSSTPYAINLFSDLAKFKIISPLTGNDDEWCDHGGNMFQNNRCGTVFKDSTRFDGQPYDVDAVVFYDWRTDENGEKYKSYFTNGSSARVITFPYMPKTEYVEYVPKENE